MNEYPKQPHTSHGRRWIMAVLFLAICSIGVVVNYRWSGYRATITPSAPLKGAASALSSSPTTATGNLVTAAANSNGQPQLVDRDVMVHALSTWARKRENRTIEIVSVEDIRDWNGSPTSLSVLATSKVGAGLNSEKLLDRVKLMATKERGLREQLHHAYQNQDRGEVNRLVGGIAEERAKFVEENEIISYKLSRSKSQPPVLSFWPGLPFEVGRREEARELAIQKLGATANFQELRRYSDMTPILVFANSSGEQIFLDPVKMAEVVVLPNQSPVLRRKQNDAGREARVEAQWSDFLSSAP